MQSLFEIGFILHWLSADLFVLDFFPDVLVGIALGSVAGKKKYPELLPMGSDKVPNLLRMMKRGPVDQERENNRGQTTISTGVIEDKSRLPGFSM